MEGDPTAEPTAIARSPSRGKHHILVFYICLQSLVIMQNAVREILGRCILHFPPPPLAPNSADSLIFHVHYDMLLCLCDLDT